MHLSTLLSFAGVAIALIVVPGPDWAYILAAGVRDHVVVPAVGGLMLGYAGITVVVAVGVGPLIAQSNSALTILTGFGAAYLMYLGTRVLTSGAHLEAASTAAENPAAWTHYVVRGAGVSALNPKGLLIFMSILPQFAQPTSDWPIPAQLAVLGVVFTVACGLFYLSLGYASDRVLSARPGVARTVTTIAGTAMILLGIALLSERIVHTLR